MNTIKYTIIQIMTKNFLEVPTTEDVLQTCLFVIDCWYSDSQRSLWPKDTDENKWILQNRMPMCQAITNMLNEDSDFTVIRQTKRPLQPKFLNVYGLKNKDMRVEAIPSIDVFIEKLKDLLSDHAWYTIQAQFPVIPAIGNTLDGEVIDPATVLKRQTN